MPFYIRKYVTLGPFRINFSKSGVGLSVGVRGFRVGTGPRGHYVHMGAGGVYYRRTLGRKKKRVAHQPKAKEAIPEFRPYVPEKAVLQPVNDQLGVSERLYESGPAGNLMASDAQQLLAQINERRRRRAWFPVVLALCMVVTAASLLTSASLWQAGLTAVPAVLLATTAWQFDRLRRTAVVFYELDADAAARFQRLADAFELLMKSKKLWSVYSVKSIKAGATAVYAFEESHAVRPSWGQPRFVRLNLDVPLLPAGRQVLAFLPDRLLVTDDEETGAVDYASLHITWREAVYAVKHRPADSPSHDSEQAMPELKGSQQCRLGELLLQAPGGLNELFVISRPDAATAFAQALSLLAAPPRASESRPEAV